MTCMIDEKTGEKFVNLKLSRLIDRKKRVISKIEHFYTAETFKNIYSIIFEVFRNNREDGYKNNFFENLDENEPIGLKISNYQIPENQK